MLYRDSKMSNTYYIFAPLKREICGMKQGIKYCLIIIFAVLLHYSATRPADILCVPTIQQVECCTLSQAPTTQQTVQKFYNLFSPNSLCIEHVDHTQVPTNKSVLLRMFIYKMQQHAYAPECDRLLNLSPHPVPDANYYVFGLRKIII